MSSRRAPPLIVDRETSLRMANIRQHGTMPELAVRAIARELGLHYRVKNRDLPGSPDLANRSRHWAISVHGCYWHRHAGCSKATTPTRNHAFWVAKFEANVARDARSVAALREMGFLVRIVWECEAHLASRVRWRLAALRDRAESGAKAGLR